MLALQKHIPFKMKITYFFLYIYLTNNQFNRKFGFLKCFPIVYQMYNTFCSKYNKIYKFLYEAPRGGRSIYPRPTIPDAPPPP